MNAEYRELRSEVKLTLDPGSPWESAMAWFFAVADNLFARGEPVPERWKYRPGALGPSLDYYEAEVASRYSSDALLRLGNVLERYTNFVKEAETRYWVRQREAEIRIQSKQETT